MCIDPMILAAVGTAVSAVGSISQGQAAANAAEYNAQVAENNRIAARQQATFDEQRRREGLRRDLSSARVGAAKSGVDMAGSALDVMVRGAEDAELEALRIRYGGEVAQNAAAAEAGLSRAQAGASRMAGFFGAGSALLSGATTIQRQRRGIG